MSSAGSVPAPATDRAADPTLPAFRVLGVRVHALPLDAASQQISAWAALRDRPRVVVCANAHVVSEAGRNAGYAAALEGADLVTADGTPLKWAGKVAGFPLKRRVYGPDLMLAVLERTAGTGIAHYFYGALPGVASDLAARMAERFPGLRVAGTWSPPVGPILPEEPADSLAAIRAAKPDIVWVSLGCPKQERWMSLRRESLGVPVLAGVGAAFDFLTGRTRQAPRWMRDNGLEWAWRLLSEPGRLAGRYLLQGPPFALRLGWAALLGRIRPEPGP